MPGGTFCVQGKKRKTLKNLKSVGHALKLTTLLNKNVAQYVCSTYHLFVTPKINLVSLGQGSGTPVWESNGLKVSIFM